MTYARPAWVSNYTYTNLKQKIGGAAPTKGAFALESAASSPQLIVSGVVSTSLAGGRNHQRIPGRIAEPGIAGRHGDYTIVVQDKDNKKLAETSFDIEPPVQPTGDAEVAGFAVSLEAPAGAVRIVLKQGDTILDEPRCFPCSAHRGGDQPQRRRVAQRQDHGQMARQ